MASEALTSTEQQLARVHLLTCQVSGPIGGMLVQRRLRRGELEQCLSNLVEARQIVEELVAKTAPKDAG